MYYLSDHDRPILDISFICFVGNFFIEIANPILNKNLNTDLIIKNEDARILWDHVKAHLLFGNILPTNYDEAVYKQINRGLQYSLSMNYDSYHIVPSHIISTYGIK